MKCLLPCNGLDKCAGLVSGQAAVELSQQDDFELICPVLLNQNKSPYEKILAQGDLVVIDGCNTRCASKLAQSLDLKIKDKYNVSDVAKSMDLKLGKDLAVNETTKAVQKALVEKLTQTEDKKEASTFEMTTIDYDSFMEGKFVFKVPKQGFFFNENDCWVYVSGNSARIGVSDYVQQNLSDILYYDPPEIDDEIEQFDDCGSIESGKAVFEIIAPVSGRVTAVNEALQDSPEWINESPYERGWLVEIALTDEVTEDLEILHDGSSYFEYLKKKVAQDV
ncbi:MAG: glycine cleavage system protein [Eubacteriaceae bacterium]|jgi:glycine cleavage system H protein|nr:glycine cleavage system protein [Eubacteriaceae bacterium]MDK2935735.1 glycine cleavage system protein [Eubacteriaceae bacterium]